MSAKNDIELFNLQCREDGLRFGKALVWKEAGKDDLSAIHPSAEDKTTTGAWRISLIRDPVHTHLINAQIEDGDCLIATVVGAVFIEGEPCCSNLENARRIVAAQEGRDRDANGWMSFETAPKDGTLIDVWANGFRVPDVWYGFDADCRQNIWMDCGGPLSASEAKPTHWRPRPADPINDNCRGQA